MKLRVVNFKSYEELDLILTTLCAVGEIGAVVFDESDEIVAGYVVCHKETLYGQYVEVVKIESEEPGCLVFYKDGVEKVYYRILGRR